jgi:FkbM family methyltransferase
MIETLELSLTSLLHNFINDPEDVDNNFRLAIYYDSLRQTASAVSYYLRTAERASDDLIKYQSLLRAALCFDMQGCRNLTVKGLLQHSLAIMPQRPEGYFLLSRFYEREKNYHDSYLIASLGEKVASKDVESLSLNVDYPGFYGILFEKAVSAWWCGLCDESRKIFKDLQKNYELDDIHKQAVKNNVERLWQTNKNLHEIYKPKELKDFDWGKAAENEWFKNVVENEIFVQKVYEKFFTVEEGDIVFDVGASVGPFTYTLKDKNPEKVYCFEPHKELFQTLKKNVESDTTFLVNKAIGSVDGTEKLSGLFNEQFISTCEEENTQDVETITFKSFIESNNIQKIDFLKSDCEGGEYDIFNDENLPWIKKNVKKIVGEWHLNTPELEEKFRHFRDTYLRDFPNHEVYSCDEVDIKWSVWDDWFIERYEAITIYIDNRNSQPDKKWKNSVLPTMEFTTSIDTKNGCVVDCVFCPQRTLQKSYKGERFLSLENFQKAVDKIPEEIRITFAGFTEPWLNPKTTEMLLYAHEKGHPISVFTTGIGMDVYDIEKIKDIPFAGNPNGGFVLHLPDQERKAKHPITDRYIKVIEKFGEVHSQIQNFTLMCMGTVHDSVRHVFPEAPTYQMWSRAGNLLGESMIKPELLNRKDEYKSVYHGDQPMTCGCLEKLYHNIMLPNGDVSLCCMDYGLEHILGNLLEQDYEEVIPEDNTCFNLCRFCENAKKPL